MQDIEIRCWDTEKIIVAGKYVSVKDCIEKNKDEGFYRADLSYADLSSADLSYANLSSANLSYANLRSANLRSADLSYANLSSANLRYANLSYADLSYANLSYADLSYANLRSADLSYANLRYANLRSANLSSADLSYANLSYANLSYANLSSANLRYANLRYAEYKEPLFLPDLYSLKLFAPETKLTFWKYLINGKSPYQNHPYSAGEEHDFSDCNFNEQEECGRGGNVATLTWCLKDNAEANEFIEVEFQVKDIVAIPFSSDGKFRTRKFKVLRKITRRQAINVLKRAMKVEKEA